MALRIVLVGLVTGLGIQPPSSQQAFQWYESGRAWWASQMAGWDEICLEAIEERPATEVEPAPIPSVVRTKESAGADDLFAAITDDMAETFARDQARMLAAERAQAEAPPTQLRTPPSFEPVWVDEEMFPGEAYALNRASDGIEEPTSNAITPPPVREVASPNRQERLATALRLTGDALHAWADFLQKRRGTATY
jgi:hypothetical protein